MSNLCIQLRWALVCALSIAAWSCQSSMPPSFADTIPARSDAIIAADLDQLLKMAGCGSKGGAITLTKDLQDLLVRIDSNALRGVEAIAQQGSWLDLKNTYACRKSPDLPWVLTAEVKEDVELPPHYITASKSDILDRAFLYRITPDVTLVATEQQAWFISGDSAVARVERLVLSAAESSVGNNPALKDFFDGTPQLKARFKVDGADNPAGDPYDEVRVTLSVRERTLLLNGTSYNKGAAVNPLARLQAIDPEALEWMPNGCVAAIGAGVSPKLLKKLLKLWGGEPKTNLAIEALIAMMDAQGGTVAIGAAPGGSAETIRRLTLRNWMLKAMLPLGEKAEPAAMLINKFIDGLYSETVDDYLAITNYDPEDYPSEYDAWPSTAYGSKALLTATVPYKSQTMKALRFKNGYELRVVAPDSSFNATLRLLGSGDYLLPAIIRDSRQIK
ncbi:MAG: hypothetical protein LIP03_02065 [Bacteroidales bacterium]|nr:hypothetical protein [Bacteroidales bacterium]